VHFFHLFFIHLVGQHGGRAEEAEADFGREAAHVLGVVLAEDLSGFLLAEILKSQCPGTVFKLFILHARTLKFQKFCQDLVAEAVGVHKRTAHTANGENKHVTQIYACMHGDTRAPSFPVAVHAHP
jgi:hypothetical protein